MQRSKCFITSYRPFEWLYVADEFYMNDGLVYKVYFECREVPVQFMVFDGVELD